MAYPAIIEASGSAILQNGQGFFSGPFVNGTNLYCILQGEAGNFNSISCYKSTDQGLTWVEQDAAHEVTTFTGGGFWSVVQSGTDLFVAYFDNATNLKLISFHMVTDLWNAVITSNPVGFANASGAIQTYQEITFRPGGIVSRSDNSFVITYVGTEGANARTRFDVWTGAVWSVSNSLVGENGLVNDDLVVGTILGAGDRTHVFYVEYNTKTLRTRTITSANAVIASGTVTAGIFDPGGVNTQSLGESIGFPAFNAATGEIAIPFKDSAGNLKIATATSVDSPVWTIQQVNNTITLLKHGQTADGSQVSVAFYSGTPATLSVVFINNTTNPYTLFRSDKFSGVWTVPLALMTTGPTFNVQTLSATGTATGLVQFLLFTNLNANIPMGYFQGFGGSGPLLGPAATLVTDLKGGEILDIPTVRSCCLLCEQPKLTGFERPILREKSTTYARVYAKSSR